MIDVVEVVEVVEDELPDVDKECVDDPFQSPIYAYDIFQYYKVLPPFVYVMLPCSRFDTFCYWHCRHCRCTVG